MLNTTFTGNITFAEIVEQDAKVENPFLKIVVAVNDVNDNGLRITVRTKNGLLEAARNGEDLVGTRVVINGTVRTPPKHQLDGLSRALDRRQMPRLVWNLGVERCAEVASR